MWQLFRCLAEVHSVRLIAAILILVSGSLLVAQDRALPPAEAVASWKLPLNFKATLFAAEPEIVQPMAFTIDDRGRIWVVECLSYPTWTSDGKGGDRITILEDTDNDGKHDKRTVFFDKGANLSGIEVGFGGVWLTAVPNLIFIPDKNGDDKPDGPPQILLDGWDLKARHNVVGNLAWGPDGWLYGCNGILSNSLLGRPGTPPANRTAMNCGVWRYHPLRHEFEAYAHGTTNPWGIDWNEQGQLFITNCVIKHIFHVIPGAHYERMFGQDINPHSYGLLQSCADHQHWAGGHWTSSRAPSATQAAPSYAAHSDAGGGHAHSGCMFYLGDNWPLEYRNNAFIVNIHGQRLNRDVVEREGSGYVARHAPDFAFSKDAWFRGLHAKYGPDGSVYITDWSDTAECHDQKEEECDKTGGRIFKITYHWPADPTAPGGAVGNALRGVPGADALRGAASSGIPGGDLRKLADLDLINLQLHTNDWHARHSRRILQERAATRKLDVAAIERLKNMARGGRPENAEPLISEETISLRAMWTLHVTGLLDEDNLLLPLMARAPDDNVCAWAISLSVESRKPSDHVRNWLTRLAQGESAPLVRLHLAAALQRVPLDQRWPIAEPLLSHEEDAGDANLPLMYWYAIEPLAARQTRPAIELLPRVKIPLVRQFLTRRIVAVYEGDAPPTASNAWIMAELLKTLGQAADPAVQADILAGLDQVYRGRRNLKPPGGWSEVYAAVSRSEHPHVKRSAEELAVLFGEEPVLKRLLAELTSSQTDSEERLRAFTLLHARRDPRLSKVAADLVAAEAGELRSAAIRALAAYNEPTTPERLLSIYSVSTAANKQDIIQTLTARPAFALALLSAIEQEKISRKDVSALVIRQLQALDDKAVAERLAKVWGNVRPASAEKKERFAVLKQQLSGDSLKSADLPHGRAVFAKTCANCHKLFDDGSKLGPELTGSQRHHLDYVLDNVLDPSAIVPRDYKVNVLRLTDGRVVQGVILAETPHTLTVQTANETIPVAVVDIEARKESALSMMPEGLIDRLTADELRDLVAYLASPQQLPLPPQRPPGAER